MFSKICKIVGSNPNKTIFNLVISTFAFFQTFQFIFLFFTTKDLSQQAFYRGTSKPVLSSAKNAQLRKLKDYKSILHAKF
jgi:hypothetical protein